MEFSERVKLIDKALELIEAEDPRIKDVVIVADSKSQQLTFDRFGDAIIPENTESIVIKFF